MTVIYDWPGSRDFAPIAGRVYLSTVAQASVSPYTGAGKAVTLAQIWRADLSFSAKSLAVAQDLQGFLESLEGPVNPVRIFDWWRPLPRPIGGTVSFFSDGTTFDDGTGFTDGYSPSVIAAASQGERRLVVDGLPASTECFRRGDLIGLRHDLGPDSFINCLYEIRSGVTANASGQALLNILPGLRAGVAIGDRVTLWRPTVQMRLVPDAEAISRTMESASEPFTLSFLEDVP